MSLTTNQITSLAKAKILETTTEVISDSTILIYANLTQEDLAKRAFPNSAIKTATVTFTNGVGTLPTDFGTLYGDAYKNDLFYPELPIEDFNKKTLPYSVTVEGDTIKVYPESTGELDIKYYPSNPTLTSAVNPTIHSYLHELIVYGILYRAFEDLQDEELATFYRDKYEKELLLKTGALSNFEEGNQKGGQMFTNHSLI